MFPISPINTVKTNRVTAKKKAAVSESGLFSGILSGVREAADASEVAPMSETSALAAANPMLMLQEISDEAHERKQALRYGKLTLDVLDELRHSLLIGAVPLRVLLQLEQLVKDQRRLRPDPELGAILDDIELRAAVELAKIEVAQQNRIAAADEQING